MNFNGQYLTYNEYQTLGGTLEEMPFNILEFEARQNIDKYSFGRLKELTSQVDDVKMCCYKLINYINSYKNLEEQDKSKTNEQIDGYSYTMGNLDATQLGTKNQGIRDIIRTYLLDCKLDDGTPYLYVGVE